MSGEMITTTERSVGFALIPRSLDQAYTLASTISKSTLIPRALQNKPDDCFLVLTQAMEWGMNPFSLLSKVGVYDGKLIYDGQTIAAVINSKCDFEEPLDYKFSGTGDQRVLTVIGKAKGWKEPRTIELTYQQACLINKNGQMNKNPDQQMCYIGARMWARRHQPGVMLGVYADDEFDGPIAPQSGSAEPKIVSPEGAPAGATGAPSDAAGTEPQKKRPPVPRKPKGANAMEQEAQLVETPAAAAPADPSPAPSPAAPPPVEPPTPPPAPAPAQQATPPPAAGQAPTAAAAPTSDFPMLVKGTVDQCSVANAKRPNPAGGDPITVPIKVAVLGNGTCKRAGVEIPLSALGKVIFDPEKPELEKFALVGPDVLELTLEQRPSADGKKMNTFVTKAALADVEM